MIPLKPLSDQKRERYCHFHKLKVFYSDNSCAFSAVEMRIRQIAIFARMEAHLK